MNAERLLQQVTECGGRLWLDGKIIKAQIPSAMSATLVPHLRQHKAEIFDLLRERSRRTTSPKCSVVQVWHLLLKDNSGKWMTVIDREHRTYADMLADMQAKFGANRLQNLVLWQPAKFASEMPIGF